MCWGGRGRAPAPLAPRQRANSSRQNHCEAGQREFVLARAGVGLGFARAAQVEMGVVGGRGGCVGCMEGLCYFD